MSLYFAHVFYNRCNVAIGYNGALHIRPQNYLSRLTTPKPHYVPHSWTRLSSPSGTGRSLAAIRILKHFRPKFAPF